MKPIKMFSRREARHWIRLACRTASRLERRDLNFSNNQRDSASAHMWNFVSKHCWSSRFLSCCTNGNSLELRSTKIFKRHLFYFIVLVYSYLASWHRWKLVLSSRNYYVVFSCQSMQQIHIETVVLDLIWFHEHFFTDRSSISAVAVAKIAPATTRNHLSLDFIIFPWRRCAVSGIQKRESFWLANEN